MGGNEKSAKGYMAKENIAKGYIDKATTRPEGRSLRAPKWDEAKNRPNGTSTKPLRELTDAPFLGSSDPDASVRGRRGHGVSLL